MEIIKPHYNIVRPTTTTAGIEELRYIEREARRCYKTEEKITEDSWRPFVQMLVKRGHFNMLGFGVLHVEFICDRGVSHEAVRHRPCTFAQESTRYVNYGDRNIRFVCPDDIRNDPESFEYWKQARVASEEEYNFYLSRGHKPQIARNGLPTCLKTELGWMANLQEWRHIFTQRADIATVHPQMAELMVPLLAEVKSIIPVVFDDLYPDE